MTAIADLRQRVTLLAPVETPDPQGGVVRTFTAAATVFASLTLIEGAEEPVDERKGQRLRFRLVLRHRADVRADWRAALGDRTFDIRSAADADGKRRFLSCIIEETTP